MLLCRSTSIQLKIAWFRNLHKDERQKKKGSGAKKFRAALQGVRIIFESKHDEDHIKRVSLHTTANQTFQRIPSRGD